MPMKCECSSVRASVCYVAHAECSTALISTGIRDHLVLNMQHSVKLGLFKEGSRNFNY